MKYYLIILIFLIPSVLQARSNSRLNDVPQVMDLEKCTTCDVDQNLEDLKRLTFSHAVCSPKIENLCKNIPKRMRKSCDKNRDKDRPISNKIFTGVGKCIISFFQTHVNFAGSIVLGIGTGIKESWKVIFKNLSNLDLRDIQGLLDLDMQEMMDQGSEIIDHGAEVTSDIIDAVTYSNSKELVNDMLLGAGNFFKKEKDIMRKCIKEDYISKPERVCALFFTYIWVPKQYAGVVLKKIKFKIKSKVKSKIKKIKAKVQNAKDNIRNTKNKIKDKIKDKITPKPKSKTPKLGSAKQGSPSSKPSKEEILKLNPPPPKPKPIYTEKTRRVQNPLSTKPAPGVQNPPPKNTSVTPTSLKNPPPSAKPAPSVQKTPNQQTVRGVQKARERINKIKSNQ